MTHTRIALQNMVALLSLFIILGVGIYVDQARKAERLKQQEQGRNIHAINTYH